jgi:hypothetical protein
MPVSGTFRWYDLEIRRLDSPDFWQLYSKGHHDPDLFLIAARETATVRYECDMEGRVFTPRHEWWATRVYPDLDEWGVRYFVNPVEAHERGAYPVTVIDL